LKSIENQGIAACYPRETPDLASLSGLPTV
jgi:hypothetical protein